MLCKKCHHCGLCQGDGTFIPQENMLIVKEAQLSPSFTNKINNNYPSNALGMAFDIGTTTIAYSAYSLNAGTKLYSAGEVNEQISFGSDVIARMSYASSDKGFAKLKNTLTTQIQRIIQRVLGELQFQAQVMRKARFYLASLIFTGNTVMQSFLTGTDITPLSTWPFTPKSLFGKYYSVKDIFAENTIIPPSCKIFVTPAISAFIGGDCVSAMLVCNFATEKPSQKYFFLVDIGTNCEMAVYNSKKNTILCTSSAAGSAFEGQGIEYGMRASEGAIAKVSINNGNILCNTIGNYKAKGICGTGLLSAVCEFYKKGIINEHGTYRKDIEKIELQDGIYLSQKDIRAFQLAKAAVNSGLNKLYNKMLSVEEDKISSKDFVLYLAGGFGTYLNEKDAISVGMFPFNIEENIIHAGNAALTGAEMQLLCNDYIQKGLDIAKNAQSINLAEESDFQELYINALNLGDRREK